MNLWPFDFETALIRPGVTAPEAACMTWQHPGRRADILHAHDRRTTDLIHTQLADPQVLLTGANTAFDTGVICSNWPEFVDMVFAAYDADRVTDVQVREKLLDIAGGRYQGYASKDGWTKPKYGLEFLARKHGYFVDKPAKVRGADGKSIDDPKHARLRFGELIPHPVEAWDELAVQRGFHGPPPTVYAKEDAVATEIAHTRQNEFADPFLRLQFEQSRRSFALHLVAAWGIRTDPARVVKLAQRAEQERDVIGARLRECGFVRPNGVRNTKLVAKYMRQVCAEMGVKVPLTKTGMDKVKTAGMTPEQIAEEYTALGEDACDMTGDPLLEDYADFTRLGTVLNKDVAALSKGTVYPIHTRFDIAATGRTTSSKPNMQNWGRGVGPRECFVPRPGSVFVQADYEMLELRTLAQVCKTLFGYSKLADTINAGMDPHLMVAAKILGISYEEAKKNKKRKDVDDSRQVGKVFNFGKPGGLGDDKLIVWAKKTYGVTFDQDPVRAKEKVRAWTFDWKATFPEVIEYFAYINKLCKQGKDNMADIEVPISGWMRGSTPYCAACNTNFQSLGASAAGRGIWYLAKACYVDRKSVLFGSRNGMHIHDENIGEVKDDDLAHDKAVEWARLMCLGADEFLPDVPSKAPPVLMRWWSKGAFEIKNKRDRLVAWDGEWVCSGVEAKDGVGGKPGCGKVFTGPPPAEPCCENHTNLWVQAA